MCVYIYIYIYIYIHIYNNHHHFEFSTSCKFDINIVINNNILIKEHFGQCQNNSFRTFTTESTIYIDEFLKSILNIYF